MYTMSKVCGCGFYDKRKQHRCGIGIQMGPVRKTIPEEYRRKEGAHVVRTTYRRNPKHKGLTHFKDDDTL